MAVQQSVSFRADVNDGRNKPSFTIGIETENNQVLAMTIRDRESLEVLALVHIPAEAASTIGQALMLASSMKMAEQSVG